MRATSILRLGAGTAALGLSVFAYMAWQAVTVEEADPQRALGEITAARAAIGPGEPMLRVDAAGHVTRGVPARAADGVPATQLRVLAYQAGANRLVRADVPLWFLLLKGPAIQFALRGTQIDLEQLGVTASDLRDHGPRLVLDEIRHNGDRLLVWTE